MNNILENIYKASLKFLEPLTPEETYRVIVQEAIKLVDGDDGEMHLERGGELPKVYASSPSIEKVIARKKGYTSLCFVESRAFVIHLKEIKEAHPESEARAIILMPLSYRGKTIGVLKVRSFKDRDFTKRELEILMLYGSMASLGIRKTHLYAEAQKALEVRDLFIAMAAHEFRTPLTTISGYAQLLNSKLSGSNTSESRWIEEMLWETKRLTNLVNELLEVNKIKSGLLQYVFKECDLREIIHRAVTSFRFNHPKRVLNITNLCGDDNPLVIGDFDKLLQVLTNIIDNAVKFSAEETEIDVVLKLKKTFYIISIIDRGSGVPKADHPRIFEGFYKSSTHTKEGMGLGLFLAKKVLDEHHGLIEVKSKENKGTIVDISLPKAEI